MTRISAVCRLIHWETARSLAHFVMIAELTTKERSGRRALPGLCRGTPLVPIWHLPRIWIGVWRWKLRYPFRDQPRLSPRLRIPLIRRRRRRMQQRRRDCHAARRRRQQRRRTRGTNFHAHGSGFPPPTPTRALAQLCFEPPHIIGRVGIARRLLLTRLRTRTLIWLVCLHRRSRPCRSATAAISIIATL